MGELPSVSYLKGIEEKSELNTLGYSAVINQLKMLLSFKGRNGLQCCIVEYIKGYYFNERDMKRVPFFLSKVVYKRVRD